MSASKFQSVEICLAAYGPVLQYYFRCEIKPSSQYKYLLFYLSGEKFTHLIENTTYQTHLTNMSGYFYEKFTHFIENTIYQTHLTNMSGNFSQANYFYQTNG